MSKILRGLEDALAYAKGDKSRGRETRIMTEQATPSLAESIGAPWTACKSGECQCGYLFGFGGEVYIGQIIGPNNVDEHGCPDPHLTREGQKAAIKALLRAVNCHEDLLAACESALAQFEAMARSADTNPWCQELRAAIAKARP